MNLPESILKIFLVIAILVGALECFSGYRIFKTILGLVGFLIGAALGAALGYSLSSDMTVSLIAGILGGLVGGGLLVAFYYVGVFLIGALLGGILVEMLYSLSSQNPAPLLIIVLAILGGVIAVIFQKFMIILSTSFSGAWVVVNGLAYFIAPQGNSTDLVEILKGTGTNTILLLLCSLAIGIVGMVYQFRSTRKYKRMG